MASLAPEVLDARERARYTIECGDCSHDKACQITDCDEQHAGYAVTDAGDSTVLLCTEHLLEVNDI